MKFGTKDLPTLIKIFGSVIGLLFISFLDYFFSNEFSKIILQSLYISNLLCVPVMVHVVYSNSPLVSKIHIIYLTALIGTLSLVVFFPVGFFFFITALSMIILGKLMLDKGRINIASIINSGIAIRFIIFFLLILIIFETSNLYNAIKSFEISYQYQILIAFIILLFIALKNNSILEFLKGFMIGSDPFLRSLIFWYVAFSFDENTAEAVLILSILLIGNNISIALNFGFNHFKYVRSEEFKQQDYGKLKVKNAFITLSSIILIALIMIVSNYSQTMVIINLSILAISLALNIILGPIPLLLRDMGRQEEVIKVNFFVLGLLIITVFLQSQYNVTMLIQFLTVLIFNFVRFSLLNHIHKRFIALGA